MALDANLTPANAAPHPVAFDHSALDDPESAGGVEFLSMLGAVIADTGARVEGAASRRKRLDRFQALRAPCFNAEARIATPKGPRTAESLSIGDLVTTSAGPQPICWIGRKGTRPAEVASPKSFPVPLTKADLDTSPDGIPPADPNGAPDWPANALVEFAKGAFEATAAFRVSPYHGVLMTGPRAELLFGAPKVLAPAMSLINREAVRRVEADLGEQIEISFDRHAVIYIEGVAVETLLPAGGSEDAGTPQAIHMMLTPAEGRALANFK